MLRRPSVVRRRTYVRTSSSSFSTISNIFSSETGRQIKTKFYVTPPLVGGTKICTRHPGHMTKIAATPIYVKKTFKNFSETGRPISTKLGMLHRALLSIIVCSNDDTGVTLTYFTTGSNFGNLGYSMGKSENHGFFRNYSSL